MILSRRAFLGTSSALALALSLGACAGQQPNVIVQKLAAYAQSFANGARNLIAELQAAGQSIPGLSADIIARIEQIATAIGQEAQALQQAASEAAAQPIVKQIVGYVNQLVTVASSLPLPPPVMIIVQAMAVLLPLVEALVGVQPDPVAATNAQRFTPAINRALPEGRLNGRAVTPEDKAKAILDNPPRRTR